MTNRPRAILDGLVAAFLVVALGAVSLLDRTHSRPAPVVAVDPRGNSPEVIRPPLVRLAVIAGKYDDMGKLLATLGPGYRFEEIAEHALHDPKIADRFDAIFLTCHDPDDVKAGPPLAPILRDFVTRGGTLYASDHRFADLEAAFPEFVDRNAVAQGRKQESLKADVVEAGLRDALGGKELPLHFDLDGWRPAAFRCDQVTPYLVGSIPTTAGVTIEAPLMVKFSCGKGSVLFTSFHNTKQNSTDETKLLKFLVLSTVTAQVESGLVESFEKGGFTKVASSLIEADPGNPSKTRSFDHKVAGKLVFSIGFEPRGAKLRLLIKGPDGFSLDKEGSSTFSVDVPDAAKGEWTYTAMAETVPYENFPFTMGVGAELPRSDRILVKKDTPTPSAASLAGGNVKFKVISTDTVAAGAPEQPLRIAITPPHFDDMGKLLEKLGSGYKFDVVDEDRLRDPNTLNGYDILFLTCWAWPPEWAEGAAVKTNREGVFRSHVKPEYIEQFATSLRKFVRNGGTLYVSDIRYQCFNETFPARYFVAVNKRAFDEVLAAEKDWFDELVPGLDVKTVEETLRDAGLAKSLESNLRGIAAALEADDLVDMTLLERPVNLSQRFHQSLTGMFSVSDAEIDRMINTLTLRARRIEKAESGRPAKARARAERRLVGLKQRLMRLRKNLGDNFAGGGSGTKQRLTAKVVEPGLREQLGDTIDLTFNMPDWTPANFAGSDVSVLLRGEYNATKGGTDEAPLLVRFKEGKGTVIFTSFHNEEQNSKDEEKLLRYLVFTTVTAKVEEEVATTMLSGGFAATDRSLNSHSEGQPTVTRSYRSKKTGRIRFALTFAGRGAVMKLTLIAPSGQKFEQETSATLIVESTGAESGDWQYTVTALRVPYENFPYSVNVSEGSSTP